MVVWGSAENSEPSRRDKSLVLFKDLGPVVIERGSQQLKPEPVILDEARRCFAFRWVAVLDPEEAASAFDELNRHAPWNDLFDKDGTVRRSTCWYTRGGCSCDYTYGNARVGHSAKAGSDAAQFSQAMEVLTAKVFSILCPWLSQEYWPNCANLNLYADGWQGVGWHSDDEALFGGGVHDCPILSLSLGARREFWLTLRDSTGLKPCLANTVEVDLVDGDVISMEGLFQKHCFHMVPKEPRQRAAACPPRINITWRWIVNHKHACAFGDPTNKRRRGRGREPHQNARANSKAPTCIWWNRAHGDRCFAPQISLEALPQTCRVPLVRQWWQTFCGPDVLISSEACSIVEWGLCKLCHHDGWMRGRACYNHVCRRCWMRRRGEEAGPTDAEMRLANLFARLSRRKRLHQRVSSSVGRTASRLCHSDAKQYKCSSNHEEAENLTRLLRQLGGFPPKPAASETPEDSKQQLVVQFRGKSKQRRVVSKGRGDSTSAKRKGRFRHIVRDLLSDSGSGERDHVSTVLDEKVADGERGSGFQSQRDNGYFGESSSEDNVEEGSRGALSDEGTTHASCSTHGEITGSATSMRWGGSLDDDRNHGPTRSLCGGEVPLTVSESCSTDTRLCFDSAAPGASDLVEPSSPLPLDVPVTVDIFSETVSEHAKQEEQSDRNVLHEAAWESYQEPRTGRRWLSCASTKEFFFADKATAAGWCCVIDPGKKSSRWWHARTGRWFQDPSEGDRGEEVPVEGRVVGASERVEDESPSECRPHDEAGWERYQDPRTGRRWLWCSSSSEFFFVDSPEVAGWQRFRDPDSTLFWWWHARTGRWFKEPSDGERDKAVAERTPERWEEYRDLISERRWLWRADTDEFFFCDEATAKGWKFYDDPRAGRVWRHAETGRWFSDPAPK